MPHRCHGNAGKCPSRSHPIWELPINELDRRDDVDFDERLSGCSLVSSCSNLYEPAQFKSFLENNFQRYVIFKLLAKNQVITNISSHHSSMVSMAACYRGGPGFKSWQGR